MAWAGIFRAFGAGKGQCLRHVLVHLLLAIMFVFLWQLKNLTLTYSMWLRLGVFAALHEKLDNNHCAEIGRENEIVNRIANRLRRLRFEVVA